MLLVSLTWGTGAESRSNGAGTAAGGGGGGTGALLSGEADRCNGGAN